MIAFLSGVCRTVTALSNAFSANQSMQRAFRDFVAKVDGLREL